MELMRLKEQMRKVDRQMRELGKEYSVEELYDIVSSIEKTRQDVTSRPDSQSRVDRATRNFIDAWDNVMKLIPLEGKMPPKELNEKT